MSGSFTIMGPIGGPASVDLVCDREGESCVLLNTTESDVAVELTAVEASNLAKVLAEAALKLAEYQRNMGHKQ